MKHNVILSVAWDPGKINKSLIIFSFLLLFISINNAQQINALNPLQEQPGEAEWVEKIYNSLSLNQKIGQLFMPRCTAGSSFDNGDQIRRLIKDFHIGGIIFMTSEAHKQVQLTNEYQVLSEVPLLISMDAENGIAMRNISLQSLPQQLMLGAVEDLNLIEKYGFEVARQCARLGVHVNFAPVADVNNNRFNPIIGNRSFGESVEKVSEKAIAFIQGLHQGGVLGCFKHFPGHGDTSSDSHEMLPVICHTRMHLEEVELVPFNCGIKNGIGAVMTAHLNIPVLDDTPHIPSSLSKKIVTDLLQDELGFKGLIFTDGLNMQGVRDFVKQKGAAEVEAFKAGNHILLDPPFVEEAFIVIKALVQENEQLYGLLERTVKKILSFKYRLGLSGGYNEILTENLDANLINQAFYDLKKEVIENALTAVGIDDDPLRLFAYTVRDQFNGKKSSEFLDNVAVLSFNSAELAPFQAAFVGTGALFSFCDGEISPETLQALLAKTKNHTQIIITVHGMNRYGSKRFGISESVERAIKELIKEKNSIVVLFGSPYAASFFKECPQLIVAYNADPLTQEITAQKLLSGHAFIGVLPVSF